MIPLPSCLLIQWNQWIRRIPSEAPGTHATRFFFWCLIWSLKIGLNHIISEFPWISTIPKINRCMTVRSFRSLSMGHILFYLYCSSNKWHQMTVSHPFSHSWHVFTHLFIVAIRFTISSWDSYKLWRTASNSCRICLLHLSFLCIHVRNLKLRIAQKPQDGKNCGTAWYSHVRIKLRYQWMHVCAKLPGKKHG